MKRLALIAALTLITLLASASETTGVTNTDWKPFNMELKDLNSLLGAVTTDGPLVLEFEFTPYRSEGKLEGCGYAFNVLMKDWAYRSNQPVVAYGSIVYFYMDMVPLLSFRIGLTDIEEREKKLWQRNASVHYAYLRFGDKSLAGEEKSSIDGEDGVKVFTYVDSDTEENLMGWLVLPDTLSVWFNREPKSTDLHFELSVTDFNEAWLSVGACYRELAGLQE